MTTQPHEARCSALHNAALDLLERVGVRIEAPEALDLLAADGVRIDRAAQRAYPTADHIDRALATAPKQFSVYGRRTDCPLVIGGEEVYVLSGGASVRVLSLERQYETATWEHLHQFNRLLDYLPHIHMLLNQVDVPGEAGCFYRRVAADRHGEAGVPAGGQCG